MKVVVSGGSGLVGTAVVQDLVQHGYEVLITDQRPPHTALAPYKLVNLEDLGQVYGVLAGAQAVAHLAAIPRPLYHPSEVVFRTNVLAIFNVFEAACQLGIKRVVYASSMSVLGYPFYHRYFQPHYVPIDEEHPPLPQDAYALSKYLGEEIALAFTRRSEMTAISLRLSWIHTPASFKEMIVPLWAKADETVAANLWVYVDSRDVAQAFRLALTADLTGHHAFFISAPNSFMKTPTAALLQQFYPDTEIRATLSGNQSPISSAKAEEVLGYKAQYTWESYF
jgi:nucleoside-diphosphate-sugar epimerase